MAKIIIFLFIVVGFGAGAWWFFSSAERAPASEPKMTADGMYITPRGYKVQIQPETVGPAAAKK